MRVLVLSCVRSDSDDAYNYRLRRIASALRREGMETSVAYLGDPPLGKPTFLHPLKIRRASGLDRAQILHAGSAAMVFTCSFLRRRPGRFLLFDMHGATVEESRMRLQGRFDPVGRARVLQERIKQAVGLRRSDRVIVVSEPLRRYLVERGFPRGRIEIVRNGVDLNLFQSVGPPPRRDVPLVTYAGRFDVWQGMNTLLDLAADSGKEFRLRVIGFAPGEEALKNRFREIAGERVELLDRLPQEDLIPLLTESELLLLPREKNLTSEVALPTKFPEYLALGRPLLLTRVGEPATMVESARCGIVVEPKSTALIEGIRSFTRIPFEEREAMGLRARRLAEEEFDWKTIGRRYASYLRDLVEGMS